MWFKWFKYAMLVYQAGIANVFKVDSLNLADHGRNATRLLQGSFSECEAFANGLKAAGVCVKTAHCNQAGDITSAKWSDDLDDAPFHDQFKFVESETFNNPALNHFLSVMDGCKGWHEVQENTGLPQADCEEIYRYYSEN